MKKELLFGLTLMGMLEMAPAALYYQGTGVGSGTDLGAVANGTIADGNLLGTVNTMNLTGQGLGSLSSITVTLNISGGNNSDLYAYLSYNGQSVVLLNRIGVSSTTPFGNTGSVLNVTLDSSSGNIHNTAGSGNLTGSYSADGQTTSPLSSAASFSGNGNGLITLNGTFGGMDPNGTWTLFFADTVAGGGNATLNGWSLDAVSAVPEPVNLALVGFGGLFTVIGLIRKFQGGCVSVK